MSLFFPHIDYCCEVFGNTYTSNIQCLYLLEKKESYGILHIVNTNYYLNSVF